MTQISVADQPRLLNDLVASLNQASGAAGQIIHLHQDPRWMMIREALDIAKEGVMQVATVATRLSSIKPI